MAPLLTAALGVLVLLAAIAAVVLYRERRWLFRLERRTVVVHTRNGSSIRGVLAGTYQDALVLTAAALLSGNETIPIDGDVTVPRGNVDWIQGLGKDTTP